MKNGKRTCKRVFGVLLALAVLFSGVCGMNGAWTLTAFGRSTFGVMFTVPETIYLKPAVGGGTQMLYFHNVGIDGAVAKGYGIQGCVSFSYTLASAAQITCSEPGLTLSQSSCGDRESISGIIGGQLQTPVPSGTTRLITWTATYTTRDGQQHRVQTYSVLYAPPENPVGAIAAANAYKGGANVYAACSTVIYGIQTILSSAQSSLRLDSEISGNSTPDGTGKYIYPSPFSGTMPPRYAGAQPPNASNLLRASDGGVQWNSQSGTAYGFVSVGHSDDAFVAGGTGRVGYDTSRVDIIDHIPGFAVYSLLNGADCDESFSRATNFSEKAYFYLSDSPVSDTNASYSRTQYFGGSYRTPDVISASDMDAYSSIPLSGGYKTLYSVITRSWKATSSLLGSDSAQATAAAACEFYGVDKSGVRALYLDELYEARECGTDAQAWNLYCERMRAAAEYLGTPMNTGTFDTSALISAAQAVEASTPIYSTLTIDPYNGAFSDGTTAMRNVTQLAGTTYTLPTDLVRRGFAFSGWEIAGVNSASSGSLNGATFTFGTDSNRVRALWTSILYTLTVDPNGGAFSNGSTAPRTVRYTCDSTYTLPTNLTRNGYVFAGWELQGTGGTLNGNVFTFGDSHCTVAARWSANSYTVVYYGNGATSGSTADSAHLFGVPQALTANGFIRQFKVHFDYRFDDSGYPNATYTATSVFNGWNTAADGSGTSYADEESVINLSCSSNGTADLYAQWTDNSITLPTTTRNGYTFDGWYTDLSYTTRVGSCGDRYTPTANVTFYGKWIQDTEMPTRSLTLDPNGGAFADGGTAAQTVLQTEGSAYPLPSDLVRSGYTFGGWSRPGSGEVINGMYTFGAANETLAAQWTQSEYTVLFYPNIPTAPHDVPVLENRFIASETTKTVDGIRYRYAHQFNNLCVDGTSTGSGGILSDMPFRAEAGIYGVRVDRMGSLSCQNAYFTLELYSADGVLSSRKKLDFTSDVNALWALTAQEAAQVSRLVFLSHVDGYMNADAAFRIFITKESPSPYMMPAAKRVSVGSVYGVLPDLDGYLYSHRTGYRFAGWYLPQSNTRVTETTTVSITGDHALYAHWEPIRYTVAYDGNGATGGTMGTAMHLYDQPQTLRSNAYSRTFMVTYDQSYTGSAVTTDTAAASFTGWNTAAGGSGTAYADEASVVNLTAGNGSTVKLYAQWTDGSVTLPTPVRNGYTFDGWYTDTDLETLAGTGGADYTPTADCTLHAKWTMNTYTVTFDPAGGAWTDGGTGVYTSTGGTGDGLVVAPPTRTGFTFIGWTFADGSTGTFDSSTNTYAFGSTDDTLTAQWRTDGLLKLKYCAVPDGGPITPGSVVKVTAELCGNPGLISLMVDVHYDTTVLELIQVDDLQLFGGGQTGNPIFTGGNDLTIEPYRCLWSDDWAQTNHTENGDLVDYYFRVRTTAQAGLTTVWLSYDTGNTLDCNLQSVALSTQDVQLPISALAGDANGDGVINAADALALAQYLINPASYPIAPVNADLNHDGIVDADDLVLLQQYIVGGYGVTLP